MQIPKRKAWLIYMGIGYIDSVIIYNRYYNDTTGAEQYFGTRLDDVRVEFTKEQNQSKSGSEDVSDCLLKIPNDSTLPKPYLVPEIWNDLTADEMLQNFTLSTDGDFFVLVKYEELNLDIDAPIGMQDSNNPEYGGGFYEYMKSKYSHVYKMSSFAVFGLIPHFQVGGK